MSCFLKNWSSNLDFKIQESASIDQKIEERPLTEEKDAEQDEQVLTSTPIASGQIDVADNQETTEKPVCYILKRFSILFSNLERSNYRWTYINRNKNDFRSYSWCDYTSISNNYRENSKYYTYIS